MHKTRFFFARLCRARAEFLLSCLLLRVTPRASALFLPEQAGFVLRLSKFNFVSLFHMAQRKNAALPTRRSKVRAPGQIKFFFKKLFLLHQNAGHYLSP
jgi:hypothetical protein